MSYARCFGPSEDEPVYEFEAQADFREVAQDYYYVAVGFSTDALMGGDTVAMSKEGKTVLFWNEERDSIRVEEPSQDQNGMENLQANKQSHSFPAFFKLFYSL